MMSQGAISSSSKLRLVFTIEPETKTRFRYESEGGSHGGLTGRQKAHGKKTYPTVKVQNYNGSSNDIFIRVTLYTEKFTEHVLTFKKKKSSESQKYIDQNLKEDYTAEFKNLTILSKKKEEVYQALMDQKFKQLGKRTKHARDMCEKEHCETVKKEAKEILNSVVLRFDAFECCRPDVQICSLYSDPISNQKASSRGDLKITRMSKVSGSWKGGEEMILLCEKIQKDNIKILFYENDGDGDGWKDYATFNPADVHYQVAIAFKTPKYKGNTEKEVSVVLQRGDESSDPRPFTYIPDDYPSKKRKMEFSDHLLPPLTFSSTSSSNAVTDDSSQEACTNFTVNQQANDNSFLSQNNDNCDSIENLNITSALDDMLGLSPKEILEHRLQDFNSLFADSDTDMQTEEEQSTEYFFDGGFIISSPNNTEMFVGPRNLKVDGADGNIRFYGQMARPYFKCDTSKTISTPVDNKQSRISENQKEKLQKFLLLISKMDKCGNTLFHLAVLKNKSIQIPILMNEKVNSEIINAQNCNGQTAVNIAVEKNHGMLRKLLISGSNPNIKNQQGNNCYHLASLNNFHSCMEDLLKYSKFPHDLNEFNYEGLTPLHIAIQKKSSACFCILIKNGKIDLTVKEKKRDRSLLHYAVEYHPLFIPILIKAKIDVDIRDCEGNTPLHIACAADDYDTVKQLLLAGADPLLGNDKQNNQHSEEENSDDETIVYQRPADLTTNPKILELIEQASTKKKSSFTNSTDHLDFETLLQKLSNLLDPHSRWENVANYVLDPNFFDSLKLSDSPTRALLNYMKKESSDYIEQFKLYLQMLDYNDALQIIDNSL